MLFPPPFFLFLGDRRGGTPSTATGCPFFFFSFPLLFSSSPSLGNPAIFSLFLPRCAPANGRAVDWASTGFPYFFFFFFFPHVGSGREVHVPPPSFRDQSTRRLESSFGAGLVCFLLLFFFSLLLVRRKR